MKLQKILKIITALSLIGVTATSYADNAIASAADHTKEAIVNSYDNEALEHNVNNVLKAQVPNGNFTISSYNKKILLTGTVPTKKDRIKAQDAAINTAGVEKVWSYLTVGPNEDAATTLKDTYATTAAKTRLIAQKGINANNIKVVTSNRTVYLLGTDVGKKVELKAAIDGIKQINGVNRVKNLTNQ